MPRFYDEGRRDGGLLNKIRWKVLKLYSQIIQQREQLWLRLFLPWLHISTSAFDELENRGTSCPASSSGSLLLGSRSWEMSLSMTWTGCGGWAGHIPSVGLYRSCRLRISWREGHEQTCFPVFFHPDFSYSSKSCEYLLRKKRISECSN